MSNAWEQEKMDDWEHKQEEMAIRDGMNVYKFRGDPLDNMKLLMQNKLDELRDYTATTAGQMSVWLHLFKWLDNWFTVLKYLEKDVEAIFDDMAKDAEERNIQGVQFKFRQDAISWGDTCRNRCNAMRQFITSAMVYDSDVFDDMYVKIVTAGRDCIDSFAAVWYAYKYSKRELIKRSVDMYKQAESSITETTSFYDRLCDRYNHFLEVEKLERTRLSEVLRVLHEHNTLPNASMDVMANRILRLADIAGNLEGCVDLLKYSLSYIKTEYDFKRLEYLNRAISHEIDNYTSTRASFICEFLQLITDVKSETLAGHHDWLCEHSWDYWQGGVQA